MKLKNFLVISLTSFFVFSLSVSNVWAAEFLPADESGIVVVTSDQEPTNLYTAGNSVTIDANVKKDLYAAGNVINVNGNVEDDLTLAGNTIVVKGDVGGSLRAAGANILIEGRVAEDLIVAGGTVVLAQPGLVQGDLTIAGGVLEIRGEIANDVRVAGGKVTIDNKIGGNVKAKIDDELKLGSQALIDGSLTYRAPNQVEISEGARVLGETDYKKLVKKDSVAGFLGFLSLAFLLKLLMSIAVGLVFVYLLNKLTSQTINESLKNFWRSLGLGFAALILTPVAVIILLVTVVGIGLGGLLGVIYALFLVLALSLASIALGSWLLKLIKKEHHYPINWQAVVLGVVVLNFVNFIPFLGWLVVFVFILISLGALYRLAWQGFFKG